MEQLLSFVIPCYRSEHTIRKVVGEIAETVAERPQFAYEIILVNDCSPEQVYEEMKLMDEKEKRIKKNKNKVKNCRRFRNVNFAKYYCSVYRTFIHCNTQL